MNRPISDLIFLQIVLNLVPRLESDLALLGFEQRNLIAD